MFKPKLPPIGYLTAVFLIVQMLFVVRIYNRQTFTIAKFEKMTNRSNELLINPLVTKDPKLTSLLVLVTTHPRNFKQRHAIRNTWAKHRGISLYFSLGVTDNETLMDAVYNEGLEYNDIIVKNFTDIYDNLTKKTLSMLEWILENHMKNDYFLKTDDDNFINIPLILEFLKTQKSTKKQIFGYLAKNWAPVRNQKSKYFLSSAIYKRKKFPNFVTGPAYLMSLISVKDLYDESLKSNLIKLEDVFLTGIIADRLKIPRIHHNRFTNKYYVSHPKNVCYYFNIHRVDQSVQYHYYNLSQRCSTKMSTTSLISVPLVNHKKTTSASNANKLQSTA